MTSHVLHSICFGSSSGSGIKTSVRRGSPGGYVNINFMKHGGVAEGGVVVRMVDALSNKGNRGESSGSRSAQKDIEGISSEEPITPCTRT